MSAQFDTFRELPAPVHFMRMRVEDLDDVMTIEQDIYPYPWTRGNFLDSLYSGYHAEVLREETGMLAGYHLVMMAVDEAHLLNISVRRDVQARGLGRLQLDRVCTVAREKGMSSVLLEVRPSNERALRVYLRYGFAEVGRRRGYYPATDNGREDAIVMRYLL